MATPSEKLAQSLDILRELQQAGTVAIRTSGLTRTHRERLLKNGFIQEVMKGWYIPSRPDEETGDSTAWYASYWNFCAAYLNRRFDDEWCLSPEQSISLHTGNLTVPKQLFVRAPKAQNNVTRFPHETSMFESRSSLPGDENMTDHEGLRILTLPAALVACAPRFYTQNPTDICAALAMIRDSSEVLEPLLEGGHSVIASRLTAAFRHIGRDSIANEIANTMKAADYKIRERENDPLDNSDPIVLPQREPSPYVNRIRLMWHAMRQPIIDNFPETPGKIKSTKDYLKDVEDAYTSDAYHSLSIEGYRVSEELIKKVRSGNWNPDDDGGDNEHRDALAARGYWQAFQSVKESLQKILDGQNVGTVAGSDHRIWYREMFTPSVTAGLIKTADLAGYRNAPVYIRRSMHTPPNQSAVRDLMPAFVELLSEEENPAVRVILGHFIFVYIHPYMDGNGRIGRFLMNAMLAGGGYPWTVIPVEQRDNYMAALEKASVEQNIVPFTKFLAKLVNDRMKGSPLPKHK
jgi:hypothetical protein